MCSINLMVGSFWGGESADRYLGQSLLYGRYNTSVEIFCCEFGFFASLGIMRPNKWPPLYHSVQFFHDVSGDRKYYCLFPHDAESDKPLRRLYNWPVAPIAAANEASFDRSKTPEVWLWISDGYPFTDSLLMTTDEHSDRGSCYHVL